MDIHDPREQESPHLSRRMMLASATALTPVAASLWGLRADADPAERGRWSAPFRLGGMAIHATLLHTDDVLIFQYVEHRPTIDHTSWVATWNWKTRTTERVRLPYNRDLFCAGHSVLPDGRLFVAGGHDHTTGYRQDVVATNRCDIYDPETRRWTRAPRLSQKRWYPTNVGLGNGRVLVVGGLDGQLQRSAVIDEYDPRTDDIRRLRLRDRNPLGIYPRMHLMPNGRVLVSGPDRRTASFDPARHTWRGMGPTRHGTRWEGVSALLSGGKRVLVVGGGDDPEDRHPTRTAELLHLGGDPAWHFTGSLRHGRYFHNLVLLPDGKALAVGGGANSRYGDPVFFPEMYNPQTGRWKVMAPQRASRMYHSTALLLPNGRVFSAGQTHGRFEQYAEIYSPPYLFRGARPVVRDVPRRAQLGGRLRFSSPDAARIADVRLMRPSSVTHGLDTEQRAIPLDFSVSDTTVTARVPGNRNLLPRGYYMLFVLNRAGVPAVAPWVRVV